MDAGVDDEPHRAKHLVVERSEPLVGVREHPHVVAERFGVERPALDEGGVPAEAHERGQRLILLRQADLEVVARRTLVQEQAYSHPRGSATEGRRR